jgi:curved DNA-binding protein CbpA
MENLGSLPHREPIAPSSSGSGITAAPPISSSPTQPAQPAPPPSAPVPAASAPRPSAPPPRPASTVPGNPVGAPLPPSPSGITRPAPSAADQQLGSQIEARFAQLSRKDHFLTLGIAQTATKEQVKSAFLNLAKTFHPDRLPPSLPHLAQKMSSVFEGIREAYETLYDETKKAAWLATRQPAGGTGSNPAVSANQAGDLFKMAEAYFKKRDYKNAEVHFGKAFAIDKSANSLSAQAWAIYMDPTRKPEGPAARQMMAKALTIDANNDRTHYQLGVIARVDGDMATAERHFREAVRVNPRHLEANQELRLIEMRKKKAQGPPKGGGGFFG